MDVDSTIGGLLLLADLLIIGFVAAAEVSLASTSRSRIRQLIDERPSQAAVADALLSDPARFLATLMLMKSGGVILAGALVVLLATRFQFDLPQLAVLLVTAWLLVAVVQMLVRALVLRSSEAVALRLAPIVRVVAALLWPLSTPLRRLSVKVRGGEEELVEESIFLSEDGLRFLINVGEGEGMIEEDEKQMIASIFELGETVVREIMVPRIDIAAVGSDASLDEVLDVVIEKGHSRVPVYEENADHILGILYAKDLLTHFRDNRTDVPIRNMVRPAYFVPESKKVNELFDELQRRRVHIAIVVDEYGGTAGLVTIEDLLEEIVGEIQDEYDSESPSYEILGDGVFVFNARLDLDVVAELLAVELPTDDVDTLGGFIYSELGHVPDPGETVVHEGWLFTVLAVESRRIDQVRVEPATAEVEDEEAVMAEHRSYREDGKNSGSSPFAGIEGLS